MPLENEKKQEAPKFAEPITVYRLEGLVQRCFEEAKRARIIQVQIRQEIVVNELALVRHISKTIIGELHELNVIRKIAPMFRLFHELERDFAVIDSAVVADHKRQNLRVNPPTEGTETDND